MLASQQIFLKFIIVSILNVISFCELKKYHLNFNTVLIKKKKAKLDVTPQNWIVVNEFSWTEKSSD